ncbi:MAG: SDR family oxidoreductase [Candidatus Dormibacteraeota bacterium]|nr:SDR family oxidoreductase [Candidatus Dormibacteraeota bacterium]
MSESVVVTGAAAGVGRAVAHAFAKRGARLTLVARDESALECAASEVRDLGGSALVAPADVADPAQVDDAARRAVEEFGGIDVWVNDAMATVFAEFVDVSAAEFKRATEVTYLGYVHGTMAALRTMLPRDNGSIVQVGSALAYRAIPLQSAYCGAKFAVRGFSDSLRTELMHRGSRVRVTMVQLPAVNTPQFNWCLTRLPKHPMPVPPVYQPEVAAEAVYWAAHHRRREVWVGASAVAVILGNKLAPWLADRYLARTGYESQQMKELPVAADRPANLFEPVHAAATRGIFDSVAKQRSVQLWATMHRRTLVATAAGAAAAAGLVRVLR